jgi:predicted transcriptional regulator
MLSVRLPRPLDRALAIRAAEQECSKQSIVEEAVRAYLERGL